MDPLADATDVKRSYGYTLSDIKEAYDADCIVLAVSHEEYKNYSLEKWDSFYGDYSPEEKVMIDIKSVLNKDEVKNMGYQYWRL